MKKAMSKLISFALSIVLIIASVPVFTSASGVDSEQVINAAIHIIVLNEGTYTTVIRNDNGALSLGKICWHGTNALTLLKKIVAKNPSQAHTILGTALYNEIVTSSSWDYRIATSAEAAALSILLATAESHEVQDKSAYEYVSGYISLGQSAGITEAQGLVFFADYANQNGRTGAVNFCRRVIETYGRATLGTLYQACTQSARRTRTYNFCASVNWNDYSTVTPETDTVPPTITNVAVSDISEAGFTVSCNTSDDTAVNEVYFAVHHQDDTTENATWYSQRPQNNRAAHTIRTSDFAGRAGNYYVYIYAFDNAGNYSYVVLNPVNVPAAPEPVVFAGTVFSESASFIGDEIVWNASATGGSGSYLYRFTLYRNGRVIAERRNSDYPVFKHTATETGVYSLEVTVTDSTTGEVTTCNSADVNIFVPIVTQPVTTTAPRPVTGHTISWEISAEGGSGELRYAYTVYKDSQVVYSTADYSADSRFTYKTTEGGTYSLTANIMDADTQVVSVSSDEIVVYDTLSVENVRFSVEYAVVDMSVTCTADISGGTGDYSCVFNIYRDGSLMMSSDPTDTAEFTFVVPVEGTYTVTAVVSDSVSEEITAESGELTAVYSARKGDTNCDGKITPADARLTLRHAARLEMIPEVNQPAADVNNDGAITISDARKILRMACGLE